MKNAICILSLFSQQQFPRVFISRKIKYMLFFIVGIVNVFSFGGCMEDKDRNEKEGKKRVEIKAAR